MQRPRVPGSLTLGRVLLLVERDVYKRQLHAARAALRERGTAPLAAVRLPSRPRCSPALDAMNLESFSAGRRTRWAELETRTAALAGNHLRSLGAADIERFAILYRRTASDLAIARRDFPDQPVTEYLNSLCGRAHVLLNRGSAPRFHNAVAYFATGAPRAFRANAGYFLASLACLLSGVVAGWLAYDLRPDLRGLLVPSSLFAEMAQGGSGITLPQPFLADPSIFLHNMEVALLILILGLCAGVPTALLIFFQGWGLGTLGAAIHAGGYDYAFWSLIAAHGVLEMSIFVTAGAVGLRLGDAVLRPGMLELSLIHI